MTKIHEDQEWLKKLDENSEVALQQIYTSYRSDCIHFLKWKLKMRTEEAEDVFQETLIVFFKNVKSGKLTELYGSLKSYLFTISWRIGLKKVTVNKNNIKLVENKELARIPNWEPDLEAEIQNERAVFVKKYLEQMREPCKSLLLAYYFEGCSHKEIAIKLEYKNESVAKSQKYRCIQKLMKVLKEEWKPTN